MTFPLILLKTSHSCLLVFGDAASSPSGAIRVTAIFSLSGPEVSFSSLKQSTGLKKKKSHLIAILITQPKR
ncbi:hypothetical protein ACJW31_03G011000 [Castanea mollissima]